jgi:hypothetical protein
MVKLIEIATGAEAQRIALGLSIHQVHIAILEGRGYRQLADDVHLVQSYTMDGEPARIVYEQPARGEDGTALAQVITV